MMSRRFTRDATAIPYSSSIVAVHGLGYMFGLWESFVCFEARIRGFVCGTLCLSLLS